MADQTDDCEYFNLLFPAINQQSSSAQIPALARLGVLHPSSYIRISKLINYQTGSTEANDALSISLVVPDANAPRSLYSFHPQMTYSIFGDDERIFGYKGLKVNLQYNASDMRPNLQVSFNKKFAAVGDTEATDVKGVLEPFLPKSMKWLFRAKNIC